MIDDLIAQMMGRARFCEDRGEVKTPGLLREAAARIADLERQLAEALQVLSRWESYGCPDCGGDCASANPPVSLCIMQETTRILSY